MIEDIAAATDEKDKGNLCRALAITANTLKWTDQDLHALYQKHLDPKVRHSTALVWWHTKVEEGLKGARLEQGLGVSPIQFRLPR